MANYEPLLGGSYIPLPKVLNNSMKGLINLKNKDHKCFMWCHVTPINPTNSHPERINKQDTKIAANLNYSDIAFLLDINDYERIEDRVLMQINVFGYENKAYPLHIEKKSYNQMLNLLLITEKDKSYYVFIKDFNRLMFSKIKHKNKKHFCIRTQLKEGEHTIKHQEHYPNSIEAKLVCIDDRFTLPSIIFKGKDCINKFIGWVLNKQKWTRRIAKKYFNKRLIMTNEDEEIYNNSQICWICKEKLNTDKVRDHCHVTGEFRGAAHNKCNLKLRAPKKLPIIFHNLQGYDGHIIFKELNNFDVDISVIPKGIDKYMSIIVNRHITFIDPLQFYNSSLDTLASNLNDEDFKYLVSEFGTDKLEILKRKDAYPYESVDSYEKFKHPFLPEKKNFYSSLRDGKRDRSNGHISNEQYLHLENVWNTFNFNTFEDFHDHYLKKRCSRI